MPVSVTKWLITLDECPSTNTWALDHLDALAPGCCVFTPKQTAGRGRDARVWTSPPGVVTASWVVSAPQAPLLALIAGLALCHAIEDLMPGLRLGLKWPNDVHHQGLKLAGILIERPAQGDKAIIGIGCNLNPDREHLPAQAVSLAELGTAPEVMPLLSGIRSYLEQGCALLRSARTAPLIAQINARDTLVGRMLRIESGATVLSGRGVGVAADGSLRLDLGGDQVSVCSGHVTLL